MSKDTPQQPTPKEVHLTPEEIGGLVELEGGRTPEEWEELRDKYRKEGKYQDIRPFFGGRAAVYKNGKWFYIKEDGTELSGERYDIAGNFYEGRAPVKKGGQWFFIKEDGTELSSERYEKIRLFFKGRDRLYKVLKDGKWSLIYPKATPYQILR